MSDVEKIVAELERRKMEVTKEYKYTKLKLTAEERHTYLYLIGAYMSLEGWIANNIKTLPEN